MWIGSSGGRNSSRQVQGGVRESCALVLYFTALSCMCVRSLLLLTGVVDRSKLGLEVGLQSRSTIAVRCSSTSSTDSTRKRGCLADTTPTSSSSGLKSVDKTLCNDEMASYKRE